MEYLLIGLVFILLLIPTIVTVRKQQKQQKKIASFQSQLAPGQRVITAGGIHGAVSEVRQGEVDLEIARGVVITLDKMGIIRPESEGQAALGSDAQQAAARANADRGEAERGDAPRDTDAGDGSARPLSE
ncbi:preprotein translocase subunit YajC [Corynebacterium massiliense]|uniref:Preprotein translocase subunit YajC n=1 Tax=Corynebacterium massiliense DSM 45435 TaxID=1121364 RepID=A0ABY7U7E2_9CORY|nr:preprotein translocase subunit YajC [Corynebacterium massiliense]WCZ32620.1 preprotein translocase subunit YajC [Corynebacterium massiliense DSM 45435]